MIDRIHGKASALAIIMVSVAACATPTPYQPALDGKGYAEQALEENRYRVTFTGNTLTPRDTVDNYLLFRAAEVTVERGYDHFVVVEKDIDRSTVYHSTTTGFGYAGSDPFFHGYRYRVPGFASTTSWPRDSYAAYANIVMRHGPKPAEEEAYDANAVLDKLAPVIARHPGS